MQNLLQDLRFALRQLRRTPGFAFTAILTLALGIGANTAIFSLLDQALLRSLPVRAPGQLVVLRGTGDAWEGHSSSHGSGTENASFSVPMYLDLRHHDAAFQDLLATSPAEISVVRGTEAWVVRAELVSGNYFTLLGVNPALGRLLTQGDDLQPDANPVAVLSYAFWQNGMHGDPNVVGSSISINGYPFQVVGVAPRLFRSAIWGEAPAAFVPLSMTGEIVPGAARRLTDHKDRWINLIGRLPPGETIVQAEARSAPLWHALRADELKALGTRSPHFVDEFLTRSHLLVQPAERGFSYEREFYEKPLLVIMVMAALVLLIAVVNVASLLLVRSAGRVHEFSMRYALGATGVRLAGQLLAEGLLLGVGGGAAGLGLALCATHVLVARLVGEDGVTPFSTALDGRLLLFNFAVALVFSVCFSLAPALQLRRRDLVKGTRQTSTTVAGGAVSLRQMIVGLQMGLSLLLLMGAGLFVRTLEHLRSENVGFRTDHLIAFGVSPRLAGYTPDRIPVMRRQMLEALSTIPGVVNVSATNDPELAGNDTSGNITLQNYTPQPDEEVTAEKADISPDFFTTLGVPLLAGRFFMENDDLTHPMVAIVNESLAKKYFGSPGRALGQHLADGGLLHPVLDTEIVGVVSNTRHQSVRDEAGPTLFLPMAQAKGSQISREMYFYLRTAASPASLFPQVRQTVAGIDPLLAVDELRTVDEQIEKDLWNERFVAFLAIAFGGLAAVLAGVGMYGVLAYSTAQRTREIGVRMALGASRLSVSRLVIADVLKMALGGMIAGIPVALLLPRLLRSQLYGVSPGDPISIGAAVCLLLVIAVLAAALPTQRAASVNPIEALRTE